MQKPFKISFFQGFLVNLTPSLYHFFQRKLTLNCRYNTRLASIVVQGLPYMYWYVINKKKLNLVAREIPRQAVDRSESTESENSNSQRIPQESLRI